MKNHAFGTALVSLLAAAATKGDAARRSSRLAFTLTAPAPTPRCLSNSISSNHLGCRPCSKSQPATSPGGWPRVGTRRRVANVAVLGLADDGAAGPGLGETSLPDGTSRGRRQRHRPRPNGGGKRGGWFNRAAGVGGAGQAVRCAKLGAASVPSDFGGTEEAEDRFIRRLDLAVRRVFAEYYSCTDVRETTESLGVFLEEATAALELDCSTSRSGSVFPAHLASRLKARLLQTADRLNYHLDGDKPMVLYRLWNRGRPIDVYDRDLLHCPRWIELVAETKRQMDNPPVVVEGGMGTICYPSGDIFEGHVDSLIRTAKAGEVPAAAASYPPKRARPFVDAELSSSADATASSRGLEGSSSGGDGGGAVTQDVRTVSGLVSLTIACLEEGMSDEATILQRHLQSPDFGHPLLRLASPSGNEPDHPHLPDDPEMNPELLRAEEELTEEHLALGERGAKELMHDRRRAQLDVYLICAAYRRNLPEVDDAASRGGWHLNEEDGRILDEMIREAAAMDSPWS
ncbi:unnamed protein product [Ectocarpus sp. 8 AP-2014]